MSTANTVWVTRAEPGASRLAQLLENCGINVCKQPAVLIENLRPWQCAQDLSRGADAVVVTSAAASHEYVASELWRRVASIPHLAVGEASAAPLRSVGCMVEVASPNNSEGLIALLEQRLLRCVWIAAGEGGLEIVANYLQARGVEVCKIAFYRRVPASLAGVDLAKIALVEFASVTAAEVAMSHFGPPLGLIPAIAGVWPGGG